MSLKLLRIDLDHVRVMVRLADAAWTREGFRRVLAESGWVRAGQELDWTSDAAVLEVGDGWELELGPPPPEPASFVVLPFALLWPPLDAEAHDDQDDDEDDEEEEDDLDEEYPDIWERLPDAGHTEFEAEFLRVRAMVEELIGPPGSVHGDLSLGVRWDVWERGKTVLALYALDDIPTYSHYDRLALGVWHADEWSPPE